MGKIIIVYFNRSHTQLFAAKVKQLGVRGNIINTPRSITNSCGISFETNAQYIDKCRFVISNNKLSSFYGIFQVNIQKGLIKYDRIN